MSRRGARGVRQDTQIDEIKRPSRNCSPERSLTAMDRVFLSIICAAVVLLVTAFSLATPSLKSDGPPEKTLLLRAAATR